MAPATRKRPGTWPTTSHEGIDMPERSCSVEECEKMPHARGLCPMHYARQRLHGSTDVPPPARYKPYRHGTSQGYRYHRCRCDACKEWRTNYNAAYTARRIATKTYKHGVEAYGGGCRCNVCVSAATARNSSWYRRNTARAIEGAARNGEVRRARQKNLAAYKVTARDWQRLCARYDGRCAYCGGPGPLQRDHVVPVTRGGQHSIGNLLPACKPCNLSKMTKLLVEWRDRKETMSTHVDTSIPISELSAALVAANGGIAQDDITTHPSLLGGVIDIVTPGVFNSGYFVSPDTDESGVPAEQGAKGIIS